MLNRMECERRGNEMLVLLADLMCALSVSISSIVPPT